MGTQPSDDQNVRPSDQPPRNEGQSNRFALKIRDVCVYTWILMATCALYRLSSRVKATPLTTSAYNKGQSNKLVLKRVVCLSKRVQQGLIVACELLSLLEHHRSNGNKNAAREETVTERSLSSF